MNMWDELNAERERREKREHSQHPGKQYRVLVIKEETETFPAEPLDHLHALMSPFGGNPYMGEHEIQALLNSREYYMLSEEQKKSIDHSLAWIRGNNKKYPETKKKPLSQALKEELWGKKKPHDRSKDGP